MKCHDYHVITSGSVPVKKYTQRGCLLYEGALRAGSTAWTSVPIAVAGV
jgi:hypothetical protein